MAYRVLTIVDLVDDSHDDVRQAADLAERLNQEEADGWRLERVIDQHRQWPDPDASSLLCGPFFIFHKAEES